MTFWDLEGITLCDAHALEATNMGVLDHARASGRNMEPVVFGSMEEAAAVLATLLATIGESDPFRSSPTGRCDECGVEVAA